MFPTNSERLIGVSDAFSAFVYGYPSSCPRAHCTPNKSVPTLRYTRRPGPIYTGHACRHLPSAVPWISEDGLLFFMRRRIGEYISLELFYFVSLTSHCSLRLCHLPHFEAMGELAILSLFTCWLSLIGAVSLALTH